MATVDKNQIQSDLDSSSDLFSFRSIFFFFSPGTLPLTTHFFDDTSGHYDFWLICTLRVILCRTQLFMCRTQLFYVEPSYFMSK